MSYHSTRLMALAGDYPVAHQDNNRFFLMACNYSSLNPHRNQSAKFPVSWDLLVGLGDARTSRESVILTMSTSLTTECRQSLQSPAGAVPLRRYRWQWPLARNRTRLPVRSSAPA